MSLSEIRLLEEATDVTVLAGSPVKLFLVDDQALKKPLLNQRMQCAHDNEEFCFGTEVLMHFLRTARTNRVDHLQQLQLFF